MNRRDFVKSAAAFSVFAATVGCDAREPEKKGSAKMPVKTTKEKIAIVYFSRSGNTRYAAEQIAAACGGARIFEVKAAKPYAPAYRACCDEAHPECRAGTLRPIAKIEGLDLAAYDVVLCGSPDWWGTMCPPMRTFVSENASVLKGKTVCIFQTNGGGGMERVGRDFAALLPGANVLPPKAWGGDGIKSEGAALRQFVSDRLLV